MLRLVQVMVPAGGEINPAFNGDYVRIHGAAVAVKIKTENDDFSLVQGQEARLEPFNGITISHDDVSAQTFTIYVGSRGSEASSAEVAGSVDVNNFPALQDVEVTNFPNDFIEFGASYQSSASKTANTPVTVVAPGANLNGVVLHKADMVSYDSAGGLPRIAVIAKASAPANVADGNVLVSSQTITFAYGTSFLYATSLSLREGVFIPAGLGLYLISSVNEAGAMASALYTIL